MFNVFNNSLAYMLLLLFLRHMLTVLSLFLHVHSCLGIFDPLVWPTTNFGGAPRTMAFINAGYSHSSQRANIRCSHYTKLRIHSHSAAGADLSTLTAILSNEPHTECAHTEDPCSCSLSGYWSLSSLQPNSCSRHAHVWRNIRSHYSHAQASVRMPPNGTNVHVLNY